MELMERLAADVGGRYVVERELGRGGMATVYLARDLLDERRVAIKVMDPELAAAVGAERFKREIEVVSRLTHPNILGIIASGEAAGTSYYVMPYVQGETLRARLDRETQLPMEDAIRIAREVASALDYAHAQGVVHRDIKPENILLEDGKALVADFGIARAASTTENLTLTKTGTALGTPHYMSPEQVMGEKNDIDGRTDQYALGCMLYEMLAGQPPFVGPHAQSLMAQHVLDEPPYVTRFRTSTPMNVEDAILVSLAKKKVDRFPTMHDFTVALENTGYTSTMVVARKQRETQVFMPAVAPPMPLWKKIALAAAGLVLLVGGTAGGWSVITKAKAAGNDAATIARLKKIAVLYLSADGEANDVALLADGLTEGLIAQLRGVQGLTVVSRDGVLPYRATKLPVDSIAARLDVGTIVTGSVRRDGDQLRVTVRLDDANGSELGKVPLALPLGRGTAIRDSLATLVAKKLREILGGELEVVRLRGATTSLQAWTLLQGGERARRAADSLVASEQIEAARTRFMTADSLFGAAGLADDNWAAPIIARGRTAIGLARLADHERSRTRAGPWLDSAEALANRALTVAPDNAEAFEVRGSARATRLLFELVPGALADATYELAKAERDTATTLDATRASAWVEKSRLEYAKKNIPQGLALLQRAYEADAYLAEAPTVLMRRFVTSYDLDMYQQAERYCTEGYRRFPERIGFVHCKLRLAGMRGSDATPAQIWTIVDSLRQRTEPARRAQKSKEFEMYAAVALIRAGLSDSARRVMERARATAADDPSGEVMGLEALVLAQLGDTEAAIQQLQRYIAEHPDHIVGFKKANFWWWNSLREDKRFRDILALAARS
jgi:serine/threonine-protein kinase